MLHQSFPPTLTGTTRSTIRPPPSIHPTILTIITGPGHPDTGSIHPSIHPDPSDHHHCPLSYHPFPARVVRASQTPPGQAASQPARPARPRRLATTTSYFIRHQAPAFHQLPPIVTVIIICLIRPIQPMPSLTDCPICPFYFHRPIDRPIRFDRPPAFRYLFFTSPPADSVVGSVRQVRPGQVRPGAISQAVKLSAGPRPSARPARPDRQASQAPPGRPLSARQAGISSGLILLCPGRARPVCQARPARPARRRPGCQPAPTARSGYNNTGSSSSGPFIIFFFWGLLGQLLGPPGLLASSGSLAHPGLPFTHFIYSGSYFSFT